MQNYNPFNYWTAGWTYPRSRLREPFPRRRRRAAVALFPAPGPRPATAAEELARLPARFTTFQLAERDATARLPARFTTLILPEH